MIGLLCFVLAVLASPFKSKLRLEAENAVLRHQLIVVRRRLLLEPVADLHEADRGSDDEFAAPGLLIAGRQGTVAQKIELVLVEAAVQSEQQPVVALTRRIDRLLIDQHGIDDAAHLDELLPVTAVAGETRDFPRRDRTDLAQADLGHHSIKASARDAARRRAPEIVIDRL